MTKILLVSHQGERCGVQQYGRQLHEMLAASGTLRVNYRECASEADLATALGDVKPDAVLFNFHSSTLPWLTPEVAGRIGPPTFGILHEIDQDLAEALKEGPFDYYLCADPVLMPRNPVALPVPRFIPDPVRPPGPPPAVFTVGSFGFATGGKGFDRLCRLVNEQFDHAVIRINIPPHDDPRIVLPEQAAQIREACRAQVTKPGITLELTDRFMSVEELSSFLAANTVNAFLYDHQPGRGISSCTDYALAAGRPIAVSRSGMFRHLLAVNPSLCVEDLPLAQIAENGFGPLLPLQRRYSRKESGAAWARVIHEALACSAFSRSVPDGRGFNKILDERSRGAYRDALLELETRAPDLFRRKIPQANIQQAFALDAVARFIRDKPDARILAVGASEDTAVEALRAKGYRIDAIDPGLNVDLSDFYLSSDGVPESYDIVLCVSVLEHVRDDELFVRHVAELLAPGGVAIFTVDFRDDYVEGMPMPSVDFRLYSGRDIIERLMPRIQDCALVDRPLWHDGAPEFEHDGATYNFATWVFRKLPAPWRQYRGDRYREVRTTPWKDQLVVEMPEAFSARAENEKFFPGYRPRYGGVRALSELLAVQAQELTERQQLLAEREQQLSKLRAQLEKALSTLNGIYRQLVDRRRLASLQLNGDMGGERLGPRALLALHGRDFVVNAYRTLLRRPPDPGGLEFYVKLIRRGASKLTVLRGMRNSPEGKRVGVDVSSIRFELAMARWFNVPLIGLPVRMLTSLICSIPDGTGRRAMERELIGELDQSFAEKADLQGQLTRIEESIARYQQDLASMQLRERRPRTARTGRKLPASGSEGGPPRVPRPGGERFIYYFVDHTIRCPVNTGMQRVTRRLGRALLESGERVRFVKWDHVSRQFELVNREELNHLAQWHGPALTAQELETYPAAGAEPVPIQGHDPQESHWLVVPEVTHITYHPAPVTLDAISEAKRLGLKTAFIFYDAIPLRRRELESMAAPHAVYMQQLLLADLVVPISNWSLGDLGAFFRIHESAAPSSLPRVSALPLPGESQAAGREPAAGRPAPGKLILSVGSVEPRKNQLALIRAFERYCAANPRTRWELFLAGNLHVDIAEEVWSAVRRNKRIRFLDHVPDDDLRVLYESCAFTVFPSVEEGYGLPILESLWYGKPCLCADFGAMGEVAAGGGCLAVDTRRPEALESALARMIDEPELIARLAREAEARPLSTWADYARQFSALLDQESDPLQQLGVVYYWVDHSCSYPNNSGIQRVTRMLARALMELGVRLVPVKWDETRSFYPPSEQELAHLSRWNGPPVAGWSQWMDPEQATPSDWLLVPELTTYPSNPGIMDDIRRYKERLGLRSAWVFYDAIPWKMRDLYAAAATESHARYMRSLNDCEKVFPISNYSREDLFNFLAGTRLRGHSLEERIQACVLPGEFLESRRITAIKPGTPGVARVLCVGTVEPRKNHLKLLEAFAIAAARSKTRIELVIAGSGEQFPDLARQVEDLIAAASGVRWERRVDDDRLRELYAECDFTVYPSLEEGFGLPILESLWHARPCICANYSAMAEASEGGGCVGVDVHDPAALAQAMLQLADDDELRAGLARDAVARPFKTWRDYAGEIAVHLATERRLPLQQALPPLPGEGAFYGQLINLRPRPLLSVCITTYNRAGWLAASLKNLARLLPVPGEEIEIVVCDNASSDRTPDVVQPYLKRPDFRYHRNPVNVGMLGNLRVTAHHARGRYVWILGDDDLVRPGSLERVVAAIKSNPGVALVYLNYAYTHEDDADKVADLDQMLAGATPIIEPGPDAAGKVHQVCAKSENFFTAIYCLVFRRDHALRAYTQNTDGRPFSTMLTCIPTTHYVLNYMMDEPACWVGEPLVVINMNVSWLKYASLWILERFPEVHDLAERLGAEPLAVDRWRIHYLPNTLHFFRQIFENDPESNADYFSPHMLVNRLKHLDEFRDMTDELKRVYQAAHDRGHPAARLPVSMVFAAFDDATALLSQGA